MEIKKQKETLLTEAEETGVIDDVQTASVSEIADAVQDAAEEASGGAETYSDANAEKIANTLKTYAQGFNHAAWAPVDVTNKLTILLDKCLAKSMRQQKHGRKDGVDVLINGLPGSGKTGIVRKWAEERGLNLFYLNAKNDDLGAILNGFPIDTVETDDNGKTIHKVDRSYSKTMEMLNRPRSVLFLDEFNRAPTKLRAVLLSLINEHVIDGPGEDGYTHLDNLLFTIACINPAVPTDPGAMPLNDAETSRFLNVVKWDSYPDAALKYINYYIPKVISDLDKDDKEDYAESYVFYKKALNLANALLGDPNFEFDTRDDLVDLADEQAKMLNQRAITDGILAWGNNKEDFLDWVDNMSEFLDKDKKMIHDILDSWVEPDVEVPGADEGSSSAEVGQEVSEPGTKSKNSDEETDDFDSIFGSDGEETDDDLFGSTISASGKAAVTSAADALNRIKNYSDFTL